MATRIVFGGGAQIEVPLDVDQVKDALQQAEQGGLRGFDIPQGEGDGNPTRIYVNRDQVALIMDAGPTERPPHEDVRDTGSAAQPEARRKRVTDMWGNPITPGRKRR